MWRNDSGRQESVISKCYSPEIHVIMPFGSCSGVSGSEFVFYSYCASVQLERIEAEATVPRRLVGSPDILSG